VEAVFGHRGLSNVRDLAVDLLMAWEYPKPFFVIILLSLILKVK
jgi:hypothetical protein